MSLKSFIADLKDRPSRMMLLAGMCLLLVLCLVLAYIGGLDKKDPGQQHRYARAKGDVDVVLVVVDTQRWDHTTLGGHDRQTTLFLEETAARGITFTNAYAPGPWTVPSMSSLMTGLYPSEHAMTSGQTTGSGELIMGVLPEEAVTLAETMKRRGYETFAVNTNFHLGRGFGFDQGFDTFVGEDFNFMPFPNRVLASIQPRMEASDRYFLWLHYLDPHHPYMPRQPWFDEWNVGTITDYAQLSNLAAEAYIRQMEAIDPDSALTAADIERVFRMSAEYSHKPLMLMSRLHEKNVSPRQSWKTFFETAYDSEIAMVDNAMREALQKTLAVDSSTLLVVTADHGEEIWDRGDLGHRVSDSLYQELIHVPLVIRLPDDRLAGTVIDTPVSLADIAPTILELVGSEIPDTMSGHSLVALIEGRETEHGPVYSEVTSLMGVSRCIVSWPYKYVHSFTLDTGELYDLSADPMETSDISSSQPQTARALKKTLLAWHEQSPERWEIHGPTGLEPRQLLQLKLLGYVQ